MTSEEVRAEVDKLVEYFHDFVSGGKKARAAFAFHQLELLGLDHVTYRST